ncbi:MAG TPA: lysophospholipid acyltransferase family protein [Rectinemataceae bacterium]|nr:lysophospholipid acyltransferase family protein [Rectinemataceae bacterium]
MTEYFSTDSYDSPAGRRRPLREFLLLGSRWNVYSFFIGTILRSRRLALKGAYDDHAWTASSMEIIGNLERCGARFHISGLDRIRSVSGPVVFVANHMSTLETTVLPGLIQPLKPVTFVVKQKLVQGPIWGPIMRSRDPIVVSRRDPRKDLEVVLGEGARLLAHGRSVIVFPQGTRTDIFNRANLNSLGIKLAARAGVPVLPVALKTDFWGNSPIFRGFGPVRRDREVYFAFGEALRVEGRGKAEHEQVLDFMESHLRAWGAAIA